MYEQGQSRGELVCVHQGGVCVLFAKPCRLDYITAGDESVDSLCILGEGIAVACSWDDYVSKLTRLH